MFDTKIITARGYAKVNLGLWVTADNYNYGGEFVSMLSNGKHIIKTVFYAIPDLYDEITVSLSRSSKVLTLSNVIMLNNSETYFHDISQRDNIVTKVFDIYNKYSVFREDFIGYELLITINKHIPMSAGLAGGSADAAAICVCLEKLCDKQMLAKYNQQISDDLANLGADITFARLASENDGYALAIGNSSGEELTAVRIGKSNFINAPQIRIIPQVFGISTADCYQKFDELVKSGDVTISNEANIADKTQNILLSLGGEVAESRIIDHSAFHNDLQSAALCLAPELAGELKMLQNNDSSKHYMITGSGPTIIEIGE